MIADCGYSLRDKPYTVAIVQARLGAERLPGKVLMDIAGKPMLQHVTDRLRQCETLHDIVVATPDKEIADFAMAHGVLGYHDTGDPNNVLLRYIKAAGWSGGKVVVRITADSPLISPQLVDICVKRFMASRCDIASNVVRRSFPKGLDTEVLHYNTLKRIYHLTRDPKYLEHVTLFAYSNPALFVWESISQNRDYSYQNWSVDTQRDLDRTAKLIARLTDGLDVLEIVEKYEELMSGTWDQHL